MMVDETQTENPIMYSWALANIDGAAFVLYPTSNFHNDEDVRKAKAYLRREHDVVSLKVTPMTRNIMKSFSRSNQKTIMLLQIKNIERLKSEGRLGMNHLGKFVDTRIHPESVTVISPYKFKVKNANKKTM